MDNAAIIVACIAAAVSLVSLLIASRLSESQERRKALWERELLRFLELEEVAGTLVDDLFAYRVRDEDKRQQISQKLEFVRRATGRFLRYKDVTAALHKLGNSAGWFFSQDMKHQSSKEFKEAKSDVEQDFRKLLRTSDEALRHVHKRL